jgi:hypothetical protein
MSLAISVNDTSPPCTKGWFDVWNITNMQRYEVPSLYLHMEGKESRRVESGDD